MQPYNDHTETWNAFQQKEPAAEKIIFDGLFRALCLYAERITQHRAQAEDVATDCIIAAFDKRGRFVTYKDLQRYLYRAVHNGSINYSLQYKNRTSIHERIRYIQTQEINFIDAKEVEVLRSEVLQEIYQEIEGLPD